MTLANTLTRRPLLSFFVLAYLISWGIWAPIVIHYCRDPVPLSLTGTPVFLLLLVFLGLFGPTLAALIMAGLEGDGAGIRKLLSGWKILRVGIRWYLAFFLSQLVIEYLATRLYIGHANVSPQVTWGNWAGFFPRFLLAALLGGPIAEETGWRGYALPRLMKTRSALTASVVIGLIWGVWHLPINLVPGANFPIALNPTLFIVFALNVVFVSIVMTWLFNNTRGSVWICYLYHALLNTDLFGAVFEFADFESAWWGKIWIGTTLRGVFALSLVLFFGASRLTRKGSA